MNGTRLVARCAELGVVVVFEPEIPGSRICGAVRWIDSEKALIVMSLRHRWADVFWFSFFHEIAHVLLHDRKRLTFVDGPPGDGEDDELEREANAFSSRTLIPAEFDSRLPELRTRDAITKFAEEIGIHRVSLGRLQHDKVLGYNQLNDLKETVRFQHLSRSHGLVGGSSRTDLSYANLGMDVTHSGPVKKPTSELR